jgi:hypothetical protein
MGVKILALDLSIKPGWAILENGKLLDCGQEQFKIEDFNVNNYPNKSSKYPYNLVDTVNEVADYICNIYESESDIDFIVIEGTVRGINRFTQRSLEFAHMAVLTRFDKERNKIKYLDPSEWRKIINLRLSDEDKQHNKLVKKKLAKGKITHKHLSVRYVNQTFNKEFKLVDNDMCDAVCLAVAFNKVVDNN